MNFEEDSHNHIQNITRFHLECDVAHSSARKSYLDSLSCIQNEGLRLCFGTPKGTAASVLKKMNAENYHFI